MLTKRIISILLAVIMLMGAGTMIIGAEGTETTAPEYTYNTSNAKPSMNYLNGITFEEEDATGNVVKEAAWVDTPEAKLATMDLRLEKDGYRLYVDAFSGETAVECVKTGEVLFSNPYSVGTSQISSGKDVDVNVKKQLLSQIIVNYTNITTDAAETFYSFTDAVQFDDMGMIKAEEYVKSAYMSSQINVKNIKNGIRVEYSIGREEARLLLPRQIKVSTFEKKILEPMAEALADNGGVKSFDYRRFMSFYNKYDAELATSDKAKQEMYNKYPITKKMPVYILDSNAGANIRSVLEGFIKEYAPDYSYEDLDEDHLEAEYEAKDENPPLFKMALEYTLDEYGLSVRLPANGIRFNESLYRLDSIEILPYMGAGTNPNSGYTFYPDGSGTIFDFEELNALGASTTVTGKVYGQDFAYHTISGTHQETIKYPVFGMVEDEALRTDIPVETTPTTTPSTPTTPSDDTAEDTDGEEGGNDEKESTKVEYPEKIEYEMTEKRRGFIAIVEEGDALMELVAYSSIRTNPYNTVKMVVYPRPQDTYSLSDSISVGGTNTTWTVVSDRKYTGSYRVRYVMLTSDEVADKNDLKDNEYYKCDYVGMAQAYRDYLERNEILERLTAEDVSEDIPIYIETFGAIDTTKRVLSIPVDTTVSLTSFENIKTMYDELSSEGVKNINFILTGYTKGGMLYPSYPSKLKWEKAVGGAQGFEDLLNYAKEKDFGIYPDFDFVFISSSTLFDGVTLKDHAVKTIDDRYTSKRVYSATKQTYMSYFELAMSPAYYHVFYEKFTDKYLEYEPIGISVSTLGTYLNSDFDEDEPYNREDSKKFTMETFEYLDEKYASVMTSGGNAYSWKYVDHITDAALDSSRYAQSAASVPFIGIVLHGYVQFAGTPINMEGNLDYALLKAIESGASLNFILSYQNTNLLKESETLSQYYSVRYDIWFSDVVDIYNELNGILKDLQTSIIVNHEFIDGERVPDADEIIADAKAELEAAIKLENEMAAAKSEAERLALLEARQGIENNVAEIIKAYDNIKKAYDAAIGSEILEKAAEINALQAELDTANANVVTYKAEYDRLNVELKVLEKNPNASPDDVAAKKEETIAAKRLWDDEQGVVKAKESALSALVGALKEALTTLYNDVDATISKANTVDKLFTAAKEYLAFLKDNETFPEVSAETVMAELEALIEGVADKHTEILGWSTAAKTYVDAAYEAVKDIKGVSIKPYEAPQDIIPEPEEIVEPEEDEVVSKYASDKRKIVLVTYENGTSFILNFNDYKVTTEVNGVTYTVDAYGYVVLKK